MLRVPLKRADNTPAVTLISRPNRAAVFRDVSPGMAGLSGPPTCSNSCIVDNHAYTVTIRMRRQPDRVELVHRTANGVTEHGDGPVGGTEIHEPHSPFRRRTRVDDRLGRYSHQAQRCRRVILLEALVMSAPGKAAIRRRLTWKPSTMAP